ncbi:MAG TPA: alkaline phosphatase D family protein [Chitinophagales bacterium]|nr:alkaline phosphatase D family protein [Chitinophagales bacterium]
MAFSQQVKPRLLAGPVIGAVTKTTAKIWIAYRGQGQNVLILGDTAEKRVYYPTNASYITDAKGDVALTMDFTGLKPGHFYNILLSIQGWGSNAKYSFETQPDTALIDYNFLLGSCALMNTDVTRGVFPGGSNWIFYRMRRKGGDFMVWLGDNIYYIYPRMYRSYEAMFERNLKIRRYYNKFYRDFLGNQPNYAIWDDHDFGPNDSDKRFALKDSSMKIFKGFWPNNYPDQNKFPGNYFSFRYGDAEFFMTDDRYYRDPKGDTAGDFLGETQMLWLKNKLLLSDATFKFICIGSQVLNDNHFDESYADYPRERNGLFDFIAKNNIKGVIFLTGDKHYSEVCKRNWNGYPLYDFTCSPLTSPPLPRRLFGAYHNQWRIKGTDYPRKNFGKIWVSGPQGNRSLKLEIYGRGGLKKRQLVINQNELSHDVLSSK